MKYYLAPLEGITGYIFRNAVNCHFGTGIEKYYTPFLMPHVKRPMSAKEVNELLPENNSSINLIPQILTTNPDDFLFMEAAIRDMGYEEINLNLGCPSKTVTSKGRGSAFLKNTDALDAFLDNVFEKSSGKISVKTRIGTENPDEFFEILNIYNKYPICELTIHPRVGIQGYGGLPHIESFVYALDNCNIPLCYNGDIVDSDSFSRLKIDSLPLSSVMIGRGMVINPGLIRELSTGQKVTNKELLSFLLTLTEDYSNAFSGETPVIFKLKEIWAYMQRQFPDKTRQIKKLTKAKSLKEVEIIEREILGL